MRAHQAGRSRFCEACGTEFTLGPRTRVARHLRPCPSCGMYVCRTCRPLDADACVSCLELRGAVPSAPPAPGPTPAPAPVIAPRVEAVPPVVAAVPPVVVAAPPVTAPPPPLLAAPAARPADDLLRPAATLIGRPATAMEQPEPVLVGVAPEEQAELEALRLEAPRAPRRSGPVWTFLSLAAVIAIGAVTGVAGFGAVGVGPAAAMLRPTGGVAAVTSLPTLVVTPAPVTPVPSHALPSASGQGPVVVEAAFTRAWRIGQRTRGVVLTVLRNDSADTLELDPASTRYRITEADGLGALGEGRFSSIVPELVPAGGRAYGIAALPASIGHPRELGTVAVEPGAAPAQAQLTPLEVTSVVWTVSKDGQPTATGLIRNTTNHRIDGAFVAVVFLDSRGLPVAIHAGDAAGTADPGVSTPFVSDRPLTAPVAPDAIVRVLAFAYEPPED